MNSEKQVTLSGEVGFYHGILAWLDTAMVFFMSLFVLQWILLDTGVPTDVELHITHVQFMAEGQYLPGNFLFYVLAYLFSFGSLFTQTLFTSSIVVLSMAIAAKYRITRKYFEESLLTVERGDNRSVIQAIAVTCSFLLIISFSFPLQMDRYYLGQFPPNVWHNSSTMLVMPFALLLFWRSYKYITTGSSILLYEITLLSLLNIAAKPSFFFCFAPAFPFMVLLTQGFGKKLWRAAIPLSIGCIFLIVQVLVVYNFKMNEQVIGESSIQFSFAKVWSIFSTNPLLSLLLSITFPILFIAFYFKTLKGNLLLQYALVLFFIGLIIAVFISETGFRTFHGNFLWQMIICNYILFLATMISFGKQLLAARKLRIRDQIILISFMLHSLSGVVYLTKMIYTGRYH